MKVNVEFQNKVKTIILIIMENRSRRANGPVHALPSIPLHESQFHLVSIQEKQVLLKYCKITSFLFQDATTFTMEQSYPASWDQICHPSAITGNTPTTRNTKRRNKISTFFKQKFGPTQKQLSTLGRGFERGFCMGPKIPSRYHSLTFIKKNKYFLTN